MKPNFLVAKLYALRSANEITEATKTSLPYITAGIAAAAVCSGYSVIFKMAESLALQSGSHNPIEFFIISPLAFLLAWYMVFRFAPGSAGSGIPQVISTLHNREEQSPLTHRMLDWPVLIVKMFSSSLLVLGGGGTGREGPSIQISAVVFYKIRKFWERFGLKPSFYNMIVAGAAGGLAAAFNTPLGGIIFAVEELAKDHVATFRLGLLEAVIAAGLVSQLLNGPYLFLGFPTMPTVSGRFLLITILISIICGLGGAVFGVLVTRLTRARMNFTFRKGVLYALGTGLLTALIVYIGGAHAIGSGKEFMRQILFEETQVQWFEPILRFFTPMVATFSGGSGGIFAPCLSAGASIGQLIAQFTDPNIGHLAPICGMIAFLTGMTRTPVTSFVLIMEMTDRHSAVFAMMLASLIAFIVARLVDNKSFYEHMAETYVSSFATTKTAA